MNRDRRSGADMPRALTRRRFLAGVATAAATAVVAACGGGGGGDTATSRPTTSATTAAGATSAPAATTTAAASSATTGGTQAPAAVATKPPTAGQITLNYLGLANPDHQAALGKVLAEYQKTYPNIAMQFDTVPFAQLFPKIQAATAGKTPVDIILIDGPNVTNFAYNSVMIPLDQYFDKAYVEKSFAPTSLLTSSYNGKFFAPPMMESSSVLWYNKTLTDKAGIKPPTDFAQAWTMDQALEAWKAVNNPPNVYGLCWGQNTTGLTNQDYEAGILRRSAGNKESPAYKGIAPDGITVSGYFDHPDAIKGHQFLQDLYQKYKVSPVEMPPNVWFDKKAVFYVSPDNALGTYKRLYPNGDFEVGVTPLPYFKDGSQVCHTDSWHFGVGTYSAYKNEAADFIKFLTGPVGAKIVYDQIKQLPANLEVQNAVADYQKQPLMTVQQQFKNSGVPRIITPGFTEFNSLSIEFYQNIIQGQGVNVKDLATTMAKRADGLIAKYKDWKK